MGCVRNIVNFYYDGIIIQLLILSLRRIAVSETQWLQKRLRFFKITSTPYSPPARFHFEEEGTATRRLPSKVRVSLL